MIRPRLFAELCAGSAAVTLKLLGGRHAVLACTMAFAHVGLVAWVQAEVLNPVVCAVAVDVVDHFPALQSAPDMKLHHHAMFEDATAGPDGFRERIIGGWNSEHVAAGMDSVNAALPPRSVRPCDPLPGCLAVFRGLYGPGRAFTRFDVLQAGQSTGLTKALVGAHDSVASCPRPMRHRRSAYFARSWCPSLLGFALDPRSSASMAAESSLIPLQLLSTNLASPIIFHDASVDWIIAHA